jgi:nucleotide-binding universal stress UspA family protein
MFEKILVLTDFSAYSRKFLECIEDLPEVKEVVILNVVSKDLKAKTWDPVSEVKKAETRLAKEKTLIKSPGVKATVRAVSVVTKGDIPMAIQRVASEENVQLVVMGARGKSFIQSIVLGSMTRSLLNLGDKHLLIMRYKMPGDTGSVLVGDKGISSKVAEPPKGLKMLDKFGPKILSKVLIPTDFSQPAEAVVSSFKSMVGVGEIVLLHVVSKGESEEEIQIAINDATEKLNNISREMGNDGVKVTPCIAVGSPMEEIRSMADKEDVSLIAMSSVGENALRVGRIGSVTYDVANTANRPVLIVRLKLVYNFAF